MLYFLLCFLNPWKRRSVADGKLCKVEVCAKLQWQAVTVTHSKDFPSGMF